MNSLLNGNETLTQENKSAKKKYRYTKIVKPTTDSIFGNRKNIEELLKKKNLPENFLDIIFDILK